jgi:hypothetical protein
MPATVTVTLLIVLELFLSTINQVYYCRLFLQTHKHYNYLQLIVLRNYLKKILKMPSSNAWVLRRSRILLLKGWSATKVMEVREEIKIKIRDCFLGANICN